MCELGQGLEAVLRVSSRLRGLSLYQNKTNTRQLYQLNFTDLKVDESGSPISRLWMHCLNGDLNCGDRARP